MNNEETVIPAEYVEFGKQVARLAEKLNLSRWSMNITPGFYGPKWDNNISVNWDSGRHSDSANKLFISSEVTVHAEIDN